jgi:hypothetical protein
VLPVPPALVPAVDIIVVTFVMHAAEVIVHAVKVIRIKVYMIAVAIGAVVIITNMLANKIAVIYGMIDGKMTMIADVIVGKTATASKLNTGIFAKRTPGITHLHLVKSMGGSAERAVGDGAGGVVASGLGRRRAGIGLMQHAGQVLTYKEIVGVSLSLGDAAPNERQRGACSHHWLSLNELRAWTMIAREAVDGR